MANMVPSDRPYWGPGTRAEGALFEALRDQLSGDYLVLHGVSFVDERRAVEGEADFLVVHREQGMLLIECKGFGVRAKRSGEWFRQVDGREVPLGESPFDQAQRTIHDLVEKLKPRMEPLFPELAGRIPFVYGHAVAFPLGRVGDANLPLNGPRNLILDADDLAALAQRVPEILAFWKKPGSYRGEPLDARAYKRFRRSVLLSQFYVVPTVGAELEIGRQAFVRLTAEQQVFVEGFRENRRVFVKGGAGSGKTVLALEAARRHAEEGRRVLMVCFTRWLARDLEASVAELDCSTGSVDAAHFHQLCLEAYKALGQEAVIPPKHDREASARFWNDDAPLMLFEAITQGHMPTYDVIVVDEGQDFIGDWWEVLEGLHNEPEKGYLLVFHDPTQDIFGRGGKVPTDSGAVFSLPFNLRNTKQIAQFVVKLGEIPTRPHPDAPEGEPVSVRAQQPGAAARGQVANLIRELVGKQQVLPEQIVVLTPHSRANSFLAEQSVLGDVPLTDGEGDRQGKLMHTSIGKYKGLESDVVILADVERDDPRSDQKAVYVAASRARQRLYIFEKSPWLVELIPR